MDDAWLQEQWLRETRWYARLSDDSIVFMDDGRPGEGEPSAWRRLSLRVRRDGLRITSLWLAFRDHVERPVPDGADGYFFRKAGVVFPGNADTFGFYIVGYLEGEVVKTSLWKVPELTFEESEERSAAVAGESLIRNQK